MHGYEHLTHTFEPVFNKDSKVLILGSFPSVKSRENNFYYGHPQNRFWKVLANSRIEKIYVNGGKAYDLYQKYAEKQIGIPAIKLPSTSPANAAWNLDRLCNEWKKIIK